MYTMHSKQFDNSSSRNDTYFEEILVGDTELQNVSHKSAKIVV